MIKVGIIGSTGYAGQNLVWLLRRHPKVQIDFLCSHNNTDVDFSRVYPNFQGFIHQQCIDIHCAMDMLPNVDLVFIALPHGKAFDISKKAQGLGVKVIDLGADFRLKDPKVYKDWYGLDHEYADILDSAVYGLPELYREDILKANIIANPGCYPTASILALAPLMKTSLINPNSVIIDAKSGVSGAGRTANIPMLLCESNESIKAYGVTSHRHTPEIEQELSKIANKDLVLSFTPHLVPMNRGILTTCYASMVEEVDEKELYSLYQEFYKEEKFVRIIEEIPETRWVKGTNLCYIGLRVDKRTNRIIVVSAIDNLIKGAAGQAIQNMNIMYGFNETDSLDLIAMIP